MENLPFAYYCVDQVTIAIKLILKIQFYHKINQYKNVRAVLEQILIQLVIANVLKILTK